MQRCAAAAASGRAACGRRACARCRGRPGVYGARQFGALAAQVGAILAGLKAAAPGVPARVPLKRSRRFRGAGEYQRLVLAADTPPPSPALSRTPSFSASQSQSPSQSPSSQLLLPSTVELAASSDATQ